MVMKLLLCIFENLLFQQLEPPKNQRRVYALEEWRNYLDDCNMIEILCSPELDSITTVPASFKDPEKYLWIIDQDAEPKKKQVNSAFPTLFGSVVIVRKAYFCW